MELEIMDQVLARHDGHEEPEDTEESSGAHDLIIAKATAMVVLLCASLFFGLLPYQLSKWFKWFENSQGVHQSGTRTSIIISMLLCFGGGVLLATTFLHLLPEISETIAELQESGELPKFRFHLAEMLMCVGFFTMYFVEELVHMFLRNHQHGHGSRKSSNASELIQGRKSMRESVISRNAKRSSGAANGRPSGAEPQISASTIDMRNGSLSTADLINNDVENMKVAANGGHHVRPSDATAAAAISEDKMKQIHENINAGHAHLHGHTHMPSLNEDDLIVSSLRGLLVVLALSVHELFEGLAVGLEGSPSKVWYMFGAVSAHKLVLAFCVGVELLVTRTKMCLSIIYIMTFAAVSPMGIGIGILVSSNDGNGAFASVPASILQGIASGTLLYVVFFEILAKDHSGLARYVAVLVGFFVMFGLQFLTGNDHSHGHSHGTRLIPVNTDFYNANDGHHQHQHHHTAQLDHNHHDHHH